MLKIIGKLYDIDSTDPENQVSVELAGCHVNSTEELSGLDDYRVYPNSPKYVFSGISAENTFYYSFPDRATADDLLESFISSGELGGFDI